MKKSCHHSVVQEALKDSTKRRTIAVGNSRTRTQQSRKTPKLRVRVPARVAGQSPAAGLGGSPTEKGASKKPAFRRAWRLSLLGLRPKPHTGLCHTPARGTLLGWGFAPNPMWGSAPPPGRELVPGTPNLFPAAGLGGSPTQNPSKKPALSAGFRCFAYGNYFSLEQVRNLYTSAASAPPTSGATMNTQTFESAAPPTKSAGPKLRAGLTDVPVNGMPNR